jgi:hypothetical protein
VVDRGNRELVRKKNCLRGELWNGGNCQEEKMVKITRYNKRKK